MINATTYLVETKYVVTDQASNPLDRVEKHAMGAAKGLDGLRRMIKRVGAAWLGWKGLEFAKKSLIDFNSDMEQMRIQMAGLMQMNLGGSFESNMRVASGLVRQLQVEAKASTATTKQLAGFLANTIQPLTAAGMKASELARFTNLAVVASQAFGDSQTAQLDIQQALTVGVQQRDRFTMKLLGSLKMTNEQFNKLAVPERLKLLEKALSSPAVQAMAAAQKTSMAGLVSTFVDTVELSLGAVGKGLFGVLREEMGSVNSWIDANQGKLQEMGRTIGHALVDGFKVVRAVFGFIVDHGHLLLSIAEGFAAVRAARFLGGAARPVSLLAGKLLEKNFDTLGMGVAKAGAGLRNFAAKLSKVGAAAGLAYVVFKGIADAVDRHHEHRMSQEENRDLLRYNAGHLYNSTGRAFYLYAKKHHLLNSSGQANRSAIERTLAAGSPMAMASLRFGAGRAEVDRIIAQIQRQAFNQFAHTQIARFSAAYEGARRESAGIFARNHHPVVWDDAMAARVQQNIVEAFLRGGERAGLAEAHHLQLVVNAWRKGLEPIGSIWADKVHEAFIGMDIGGGLKSMFEGVTKHKTEIHIDRIEVPAKDPDRWIGELDEAIAKRSRARRQAHSALMGGF